jgi:hypothetical protein
MTDSDHIMQLRQQVANLHASLVKARAERDQAQSKVERIMSGLEGCCMTCEPIGVRNQQMVKDIKTMQDQRDEARREICEFAVGWQRAGMRVQHPQQYAHERGWDCYKENP